MSEPNDPGVARLLELASQAPDKLNRLSYLLEASIRPGLSEFLKNHVLTYDGPKATELPGIYMLVFAKLTAELIENYMANTGDDADARSALRKYCKDTFGRDLDWTAKAVFSERGQPMRRPNA